MIRLHLRIIDLTLSSLFQPLLCERELTADHPQQSAHRRGEVRATRNCIANNSKVGLAALYIKNEENHTCVKIFSCRICGKLRCFEECLREALVPMVEDHHVYRLNKNHEE